MKCIECGAYVYNADKFCRNCGTKLTNETCQYGDNISKSIYDSSSCHQKQYDYSYNYSNKEKPTYNTNASHVEQYEYSNKYSFDYSKFDYINKPNDSEGEDKYIKAYIGQNYKSIKTMRFSIPAFLFGPIYLLYRKVWKYAIFIIIISLAGTIFLSDSTFEIIDTIINIILAFKFKDIYLKQAEEKVENIKQQNLDKTTNELLSICQKKGGISWKEPIIAIIASTLFTTIILGSFINDNNSNNNYNYIEELSYSLPIGFEELYITENYKNYNYTTKNQTTCHITLNYSPVSTYMYDEISYLEKTLIEGNNNQTISKIQNITLNNNLWKYKQLTSASLEETSYAIKHQDKIYVVRTYNYRYNDKQNDECKLKYNEFLETLDFENN